MQPGEIINNSYILKAKLGKNPFSETWSAEADSGALYSQAGTPLIVKCLSLGEMPDWKGMELFERETAALKAMRHPSVPRYIDSFKHDQDENHYLALVMEHIPGRNIATEVEAGRRFTETEIEQLIAELLDIVTYLHSLRPPIIHRDINPKNIMLKPDGHIALVDFSGVQDAVRLSTRDSATMIGTAGYAPHEQIMGRASTRSDLYAIAATAAFLLTQKHPPELPQRGMKPDPAAVVELSPALACVLDNYLEPDEANRTLPPEQAAAILRGNQPCPSAQTFNRTVLQQETPSKGPIHISAPPGQPDLSQLAAQPGLTGMLAGLARNALENAAIQQQSYSDPLNPLLSGPVELPQGSKVKLISEPELLDISMPRAGIRNVSQLFLFGFSFIWLSFIGFWTFMSIAMEAPFIFPLFSIPFWAVGIFLLHSNLKSIFSRAHLQITPETGLVFEEQFIGRKIKTCVVKDLGTCRFAAASGRNNINTGQSLTLDTGTGSITFARGLSTREQLAIQQAINSWLTDNNL